MQPIDTAAATAETAPPPARRCENCGSPLYGDHCFACGQPIKGMVRHFSTILGDFVDTVFNIDSRVLRTMGPLLYRPGYLSLEYFAGRRVRYVTPMRLFLFLSLIAFFAVRLSITIQGDGRSGVRVGAGQGDSFDRAKTVAEVELARDKLLAELSKRRKKADNVPAGTVGIDIATDQIEQKAARRIARLTEIEAARKAGKPLPAEVEPEEEDFNINLNGKPWHAEKNPVSFSWLPDAANKSLQRRMVHARDEFKGGNPGKLIVDSIFNVLPQTLLVMMPLFALMLKIVYWFKRRLYMEHLIVALHSHAFIALEVTLVMGLAWLIGMVPDGGFWDTVLNWVRGLAIAWIPLYLLLMQKRVYGQGWLMTLVKFAMLGLSYAMMLAVGIGASLMIGLLTL